MSTANSRIDSSQPLSNGAIAATLNLLAQLLAVRGENPFKVKAYRRAARTIRTLGESVDQLVREGVDLTQYSGIGPAISSVVQEIVQTGTTRQLERMRAEAAPEILDIAQYSRLDPRRVQRIYKKLGIASTSALREKLESGEIAAKLGAKAEQHVRRGLQQSSEMLWYEADKVVVAVQDFLVNRCGVRRAEPVGDYRRRVEIIREIAFVVETNDLPAVLKQLENFGGRSEIIETKESEGLVQLSSGVLLRIVAAGENRWGLALIVSTGSDDHVRKLRSATSNWKSAETDGSFPTESSVYDHLGLSFIPPELREGRDEITLAAHGRIPVLVSTDDIRGELHAHSTSSDGVHTVEQMAAAAMNHGYQYIGITDHSRSLKIARGLSEEALWEQIRVIDKLNARLNGIRILKSAEVDILVDGSLDYSADLLKELDYTVCSIHSRFGLGKAEQTDRILRAMDNRYFNILGHATGRLLLKRPGYEIDVVRVIECARTNGCYFEINSSPDRLDLSSEYARLARESGVKVAITTDAHSVYDFEYLRFGVDQARRAGFTKNSILNHFPWSELERCFRR